ncbi:AAA family ATPase [Methylobacterium ajmalii]|uniref:AAA family ATPase n=1 Tax=Methylobacterium ajmalii TaxID=2738439 RepID=A0ABV0A4F0_9HYPH
MSGTVTAIAAPQKITLASLKEPVVLLIKQYESFKHITIDGEVFIDWREPDNTDLRDSVLTILRKITGMARAQNFTTMFAVSALSKEVYRLKARYLEDYLQEETLEEDDYPESFAFFQLLEAEQKHAIEAYEARVKEGVLEFDDFPLHFKPGQEIVAIGEDLIGGVVTGMDMYSSFFEGSGWAFKIKVIHALAGSPQESEMTVKVRGWGGVKPIADLPIAKAEGELRDRLVARGRILARVATGAHYMRYRGEMSQTSWSGITTFRADGRIMVDARSCMRIDGDRYRMETQWLGLKIDSNNARGGDGSKKAGMLEIAEADLWRTFPIVIGFSFRTKKWGSFRVDNISEIEWRTDAFDYLVMDDNEKGIIRSLVETKGEGFQDIVEEKGGGTIFLLEGRPGLGKTLTAETVAEMTHQPLYSISVGELGTNPTQLENTLRTILDIASIWNAVLLLDEADIFLEARDTKDVVRNAMVGVFLRLVEYHQGILFLTTNRAANIDPAFLSRISIPLSFPDADEAKLRKIWENLIKAAGVSSDISDFEIAELSKHKINGRQIKNALKIGQTLARAENRPITVDDIRRPLEMSESFHTRVRGNPLSRLWRRLAA